MPKRSKINKTKYVTTGFAYLTFLPLILFGVACMLSKQFIAQWVEVLQEKDILLIGGLITALGVLFYILFIINSQVVICRLCRAQFFKRLKCARHKNADSFLGNVKIPLALGMAIQKSSIRCPYCGEKHVYFHRNKK